MRICALPFTKIRVSGEVNSGQVLGGAAGGSDIGAGILVSEYLGGYVQDVHLVLKLLAH
jgi:hypothetical protein